MGKRRKAPTLRANPVSKKQKYDHGAEDMLTLGQAASQESGVSDRSSVDTSATLTVPSIASCSTSDSLNLPNQPEAVNTGNTDSDRQLKATQTSFACSDVLSCKLDSIVSKRRSTFHSPSQVDKTFGTKLANGSCNRRMNFS